MTTILHIIFKGDESVGIPETHFEIQCPFQANASDFEKKSFKDVIVSLYRDYCDTQVRALYDFELAQLKDNDYSN